MENILVAKGITKTFPGVLALDNIDIEIGFKQIHAFIGENGAGKSTLIKCLTGVYTPNHGKVLIDGVDALDRKEMFSKVAYVPQEINLFEELSVAENLFLPFEMDNSKFVSINSLYENSKEVLSRFKINVKPDTLVKNITVSQKQLLQIARATLTKDYKILMLDEPTTSLTAKDTENFFEIVKNIRDEGKSIVFISHKLEEIFLISDVISVFRNGKKIGFHDIDKVTEKEIVKEMTGREIDSSVTYSSQNVLNEKVLEVKNLTGEFFKDISFTLNKGEILGFSGLVGSGRSELMQAIFGYLPYVSGEVKIDDVLWKERDTAYSVKNGLVYLPEERKQHGIFPFLSVRENISLPLLNNLFGKKMVSNKQELITIKKIIDEYEILTSDTEKKISFLSGGNQQKAIIGRSMYTSPKVLIFDEPTKGIDVGTKTEIYKLMKELAESKGIGIILISSEIEEILKCSNRVISLYLGKIMDTFESPFNKEKILSSMLGIRS